MSRATIVVHVAAPLAPTLRCLEALEAHTPPERYDVVLVDDASPPETAALLADLGGDVRLLRHQTRQGAAASFSAGAAEAGEPWVVLLGTDIVVTPGWLEALLDAATADPSVAAVQPKVVAADGTVLDAGGFLLRDGRLRPYASGVRRLEEPMLACPREVTALTGGCTLVRTEDARCIPAGYESAAWALSDLAQTIVGDGRRAVLEPRAVVQRTTVDDPRTSEADRLLLAARWAAAIAAAPDWRVDDLGATDWWALPTGPRGKRILVIDPWSPTFDRDTGHKRLVQMLAHLRSRGDAVVYYAETAMDRPQYGAHLAAMGIPLYGRDPARRHAYDADEDLLRTHAPILEHLLARFRFDTVVFSFFSTAERYLPLVRAAAPDSELVVDSVDIHFLRERRMADVEGDPALRAKAEETRRRELAAYAGADRVLCVSPDDAAVLREQVPALDIAIVPVVYEDVEQGPGFDERDRIVFVASSAHMPNVDAVRWWKDEIAPRLADVLPGVPLTVVGFDPGGTMAAFHGDGVDVIGPVDDVIPWLHRSRLTVVPLRWGAGVKGKVIEAMMAGVPVVGTPIAVEGMGVRAGTHALVAEDPDGLAAAVARAYGDRPTWESLRREGRALVERDFSLAALGAALDVALELPARGGNRAARRFAGR